MRRLGAADRIRHTTGVVGGGYWQEGSLEAPLDGGGQMATTACGIVWLWSS